MHVNLVVVDRSSADYCLCSPTQKSAAEPAHPLTRPTPSSPWHFRRVFFFKPQPLQFFLSFRSVGPAPFYMFCFICFAFSTCRQTCQNVNRLIELHSTCARKRLFPRCFSTANNRVKQGWLTMLITEWNLIKWANLASALLRAPQRSWYHWPDELSRAVVCCVSRWPLANDAS